MNQPTAGKRILVADDESHIVHVVSLKLKGAGYEVVTACDGEEALELAVELRPDLIISDYQMPFMDGLELCRTLKRTAETRSTPVLLLTARGFSITPDDLEPTNIVAVLSKPFSPREVLSRVQQQLLDPHPTHPRNTA